MTRIKLLLILAGTCSSVFGFAPTSLLQTTPKPSTLVLYDFPDDIGPSDYDTDYLPPAQKKVTVDDKEEDVLIRDDLKRELLLLASVTNRGVFANKDERSIVLDLVSQLEALNPTANPASHCDGEWELCFSSTQLFRSSPFFQTIRIAMGDDNKQMAENAFTLHDRATAGSRIGRIRETLTSETLTSEVDLEVGVLPGLPFKVKGTVVTTASMNIVSDKTMELQVQTTRVKGSNIPVVNQIIEDQLQLGLPIGDMYSRVTGDIPVIPMQVRCCRNSIENVLLIIIQITHMIFLLLFLSFRHSMSTKACVLLEILTKTFSSTQGLEQGVLLAKTVVLQ
jgi:hypothetical protein